MESHILVLNSNRSEVQKFEKLLETVNSEFCLEAERFINFQIACSEAIINAIVHGNKEDPLKQVHTEIRYNTNEITAVIMDQGIGFNVEALPDPTSGENLFKESGRGIYIIRSLVDKFECTSSASGTKFVLSMIKQEAPK